MVEKIIKIKLKHNYGFEWSFNNGIFVKGYLFDKRNKLFKDEGLIDFFLDVKNREGFEEKIKNSNGTFSVIINFDNKIFAAVDKTRTFPLFYFDMETEFIITDDTYYIKEKYELDSNQVSKIEFLYARYVTGKETLLNDVFQIQAGEYLIYDNGCETTLYHDYLNKEVDKRGFEDKRTNFLDTLKKQTLRLINSVQDKTIVIPLSSGYDSRLVASLLKIYNYNNVICFTYGKKDSYDVSISRDVAKQLGFKWIFVEYHNKAKSGNYVESMEFRNYCKYAFNHSSLLILQDYFIVKELKSKNLIPNNSVFVPGHSGDMLVGNHLYQSDVKSIKFDEFIEKITKRHFVLQPYFKNNKIELKLKKYFSHTHLPFSLIDNYNLKERQSKYIINSVRIYEYFGYEHRMPLWDSDLVEFFRKLDFKSKYNSNFYKKIIFNDIFFPLKIDMIPPDKIGQSRKIKKYLKQISSSFLLSIFRKYFYSFSKVNDSHPFANILNFMGNKVKTKSTNINGVVANWIIKENQI